MDLDQRVFTLTASDLIPSKNEYMIHIPGMFYTNADLHPDNIYLEWDVDSTYVNVKVKDKLEPAVMLGFRFQIPADSHRLFDPHPDESLFGPAAHGYQGGRIQIIRGDIYIKVNLE